MIRGAVSRRRLQNRGVHLLRKIGSSCELQIHRFAAGVIPISGIGDRQRSGGRHHAAAFDFRGNDVPACGSLAPHGVNKKCMASKSRRNFAAVSSSNSNGDPPILRCTADITLTGRSRGNLCKTGAKCSKCDWIPEILYPQPNVFLKNGRVYPINLLSVVTGPPNRVKVNTT
jgi:hypothetical protein